MDTGNLFQEILDAIREHPIDAVSAIFAAIALIVSIVALCINKKGLIKQIRLSVFSDSIHSVLQDKSFQESQEYVLSGAITKDVERVRKISNKEKTDRIGLDDFKEIIRKTASRTPKGGNDKTIPESDEVMIRKSYNKIMYFCSRMEYLGVISSEEQSRSLVIGFYGQTIRESYPKLYPLIEMTRENVMKKKMFEHYTKMYYRISIPFPVITEKESDSGEPHIELVLPNEKKHNKKRIKIYYTIDGNDPTANSTLYKNPIPLENTITTVKAISIKGRKGDRRSPIVTKTFHANFDGNIDKQNER